MKRCPTCQNTFDDSLRFCQLDGTLLVDDAGSGGLPVDPLKTMVGGAPIHDDENDLLQLGDDATKTLTSPTDSQSGQTPFDANNAGTSSPFDSSNYQTPSTSFSEPLPPTSFNPSQFDAPQNSFDSAQNQYGQPLQQSSWTPPPAPDAGWQSQNIGANTPFQPPMVGAFGDDKTLPIVALVCGILSLTCCGPITGIVALITGFMGKNNADTNPQQYGGRGLALAGMIMGGISLVLTVLYVIFVVIIGIGGGLR